VSPFPASTLNGIGEPGKKRKNLLKQTRTSRQIACEDIDIDVDIL